MYMTEQNIFRLAFWGGGTGHLPFPLNPSLYTLIKYIIILVILSHKCISGVGKGDVGSWTPESTLKKCHRFHPTLPKFVLIIIYLILTIFFLTNPKNFLKISFSKISTVQSKSILILCTRFQMLSDVSFKFFINYSKFQSKSDNVYLLEIM